MFIILSKFLMIVVGVKNKLFVIIFRLSLMFMNIINIYLVIWKWVKGNLVIIYGNIVGLVFFFWVVSCDLVVVFVK